MGSPLPSFAGGRPCGPLVRRVLCRATARRRAPRGRRSVMKWWRAAGGVAVTSAAVLWACGGGSGEVAPGRDSGPPLTDGGGGPDAGPPDAGPPDAGPPDAGPPDAGPPDGGGFIPPPAIP